MSAFLWGLARGAVGVAIVVGAQLTFGLRIDLLTAAVFGGIVVAVSIAIELGKQKGIREAEFGSNPRNSDNG